MICAVATAIFNSPIDALFNLLSAPTADAVKVKAADTLMKRTGRRMSNAAAAAARRVSVAASDALAVAKTLAGRNQKHQLVAGAPTRSIPETTKSAKKLATASISVIADRATQNYKKRTMMRRAMSSRTTRPSSYLEEGEEDLEDDESDYIPSDDDIGDSDDDSNAGGNEAADRSSDPQQKSDKSRKASKEGTFEKLKLEIMHQRRLLSNSEVEGYDNEWGLDPTGEFVRRDGGMLCLKGESNAEKNIRSELAYVDTESKKKIEKLSMADDDHTGLEILHLFVLDLLGRETNAARIFESKTAEDFKHKQVVTRKAKALAWFGLFLLNLFFVYYSMVG